MKLVRFVCLFAAGTAGAADGPLRVAKDPHWLEYRDRPVLLAGDSITQGWMELGTNFDQKAYVDALGRRGINTLLLWSYIGITDSRSDPRVGYESPALWPWAMRDGRFDLGRFNEAYFQRLRELASYSGSKGIVVVITVHDGWTKTRFGGHPFNRAKGGPLAAKEQYVELHDYAREMARAFHPEWSWREQHQYFLERFCERLIGAVGDLPNVMFEIFNEGEWYNQPKLAAFQAHFLKFFKERTRRVLAVNADHIQRTNFRAEPNVDLISLHTPRWDDLPAAHVFFRHFQAEFHDRPARPLFFSETVPEYSGEPGRGRGILRLLWGTALGGAGVVVQNDSSWGFDQRSALAQKAAEREQVLDFEGHLARFLNDPRIAIADMRPDESLSSTGVCLAQPGSEYVVYAEEPQAQFTVDLSAAAGKRFTVRWYNPRTGEEDRADGIRAAVRTVFTSPFSEDSVLHLKRVDSR